MKMKMRRVTLTVKTGLHQATEGVPQMSQVLAHNEINDFRCVSCHRVNYTLNMATDEEEEMEEQTERQSEAGHDSGTKVFRVTCGALTGTLHRHRFATGSFISLYTHEKVNKFNLQYSKLFYSFHQVLVGRVSAPKRDG